MIGWCQKKDTKTFLLIIQGKLSGMSVPAISDQVRQNQSNWLKRYSIFEILIEEWWIQKFQQKWKKNFLGWRADGSVPPTEVLPATAISRRSGGLELIPIQDFHCFALLRFYDQGLVGLKHLRGLPRRDVWPQLQATQPLWAQVPQPLHQCKSFQQYLCFGLISKI